MTLLGHEASRSAVLFWGAALFIVYTYGFYPLLVALAARLFPRPIHRQAGHAPSLSIVIAAYNEEAYIRARIDDLLVQDYPAGRIEIVAVSDGSTDTTPLILSQIEHELALNLDRPQLRALSLEVNQGKAVALNAGVAAAGGELIVFADARQRFAPGALASLAENFADGRVGAVSGELILTEGDSGVASDFGLYWRYEKWIRRAESAIGSMLGATGAIYAIRRALWRPLPEGTLLDDFLTPMRIVLQGYRVIFDGRAVAWDRTSANADQEFRRKIRTLSGNYQAFAFEPALLQPWRNPSTWFQVWSHKLGRLLVPYALILLLGASLATPGWFYLAATLLQLLFYGLAIGGWTRERQGHPLHARAVSFAYTFVTLNSAAVAGFWSFLRRRRHTDLWRKAYTTTAPGGESR